MAILVMMGIITVTMIITIVIIGTITIDIYNDDNREDNYHL